MKVWNDIKYPIEIERILLQLVPVPGPYLYKLDCPKSDKDGKQWRSVLWNTYARLEKWAKAYHADCKIVETRGPKHPRRGWEYTNTLIIELTDPVVLGAERLGFLGK